MFAGTLTLLESNPLPGGYSELTFGAERALSPPRPGQYLSIAPAPDIPPVRCIIMQAPAPDRLQVLARFQFQIARGTVFVETRIEGEALDPDPARPDTVLVSAGSALACSIFAASRLRTQSRFNITVFAEFDTAPPFKPAPSQILMPGCPPEAIAAVPLLDAWNIPSRLASRAGQNGFYQGDIRGLLEYWWQGLRDNERAKLQILGFGEDRFLNGLREWCKARRIPLRTALIP